MGDIKALAQDEIEDIRKEVEILLTEIDETHRYSMSRIYGLYNKVFNKNETPQSCASCLLRKADQLKKWLKEQPIEQEVIVETKKTKRKGKDNV